MTNRNKVSSLLFLATFVVATGILLATPAQACDVSTISGSYGYHAHGFGQNGLPGGPMLVAPSTSSGFPVALQGSVTFDGAGTITNSTQTAIIAGSVPVKLTFVGSYSVNDDCSGTVTRVLPGGFQVHWDIQVVKGGTEILFLYTEPGVTMGGTLVKQ